MFTAMAENLERHDSGLVRRIGLFTAVMIVAGGVIGSGVFKKVVPMSVELGSGWLVLAAWFVAGAVTLAGALINAEIGGIIAEPGGQYKYFERMYGRFFAYIYGWASFAVIQTATVSSIAYVFAQSINLIVPIPNPAAELAGYELWGVFQPFDNFGVKLLAIGLIVLLTVVNAKGLEYGSLIANVFSSAVILCIVGLTVVGFGFGTGAGMAVSATAEAASGLAKHGFFSAFFTAMMAAFWAYEGWNSLGFMGGEIKDPTKTIPRALVLGVAIVMLVYIAVNAAFLWVLPVDSFMAMAQQENSIAGAEVIKVLFGPVAMVVILVLIIVATLNATNSSLMTASRIWFAMALDGLFLAAAGRTNKANVPGNALLMMGAWSALLVLSGSFDQLTDMLIFAAFLFYGAGAFGVFVLRRTMPNAVRLNKVPGYPIVPALFVAFCAALVVNSVIERPREAGIGMALILIGIPFYKRSKGKVAEATATLA